MSNSSNFPIQYHPSLKKSLEKQLNMYKPLPAQSNLIDTNINKQNQSNKENFIDWDDPYKNIRFWTIIDFLREFKLTK